MTREEKTKNWLASKKVSKVRRADMSCKAFTLKMDKDKLGIAKLEYLNDLFTEAKWLYNYILGRGDLFSFDTSVDTITSLDKDGNVVERKLEKLGSQMKQGILQKIKESIASLAALKKAGFEVGALKFKARVDSIRLNQFGFTYKLAGSYLKLQGCKKLSFKLLGLEQIPEGAEMASAVLVRRNGDFHLKITCYVPKKANKPCPVGFVGIDAGCGTTLTLSDGVKYNVKFPESKRTRFLRKALARKVKHSRNYAKQLVKVNKSQTKTLNRKKDKINKVVAEITNRYHTIFTQDESVSGWKKKHGRSVQASSVGGIMVALRGKARTSIVVDKWFPSTQFCCVCGARKKMGLWERVYECPACGNVKDRDVNSATNIEVEGKKQLPAVRREVKPVELEPSAVCYCGKIPTMKQEARSGMEFILGQLGQGFVEAPAFRQG